ncbi:hypothetical protein BD414DRAFT_481654 [Trametes punicea]|nr:hypothetical protein BD414DRAFT_481654 [Trametes punicea]
MHSLSSPVEHPRKRQRTVERRPSSRGSGTAHAMPHEANAADPSGSGSPPRVSIWRQDSNLNDDTRADSDDETRQGPARPDFGDGDGDSGVYGLDEENMKASPLPDKGKAPAIMTTLSQGSHRGPAATRHADTERTHDDDRDRDRGGLDRSRHSASGAGAKASLMMDIDAFGLARTTQAENAPVRDAEYYIEGADCAIRVEDTLFRVHRYLLGRDNSAFQHMFSMPTEAIPLQNMEGYSDENPINIYGESAERFRALLSVLYDLPPQLQKYNTSESDMDRLLTICEMTNKYHFASIENWAIDAVYNVVSGLHGPPQPQYHLNTCTSSWMRRLLEVAVLCGHERLRDFVASRWVDRITARDLRPVHALDIAARSSTRNLEGIAYYVQLLEMGPGFDPGVVEDGEMYSREQLDGSSTAALNGEARIGTLAVLTREQKQRLLLGHWSLTRLWERLRTTPPTFERPDGCTYHQHGCVSTWTQVWREVGRTELVLRLPVVDVVGRLREMMALLRVNADLTCALSPQCKRAALLALSKIITEVKADLASHFSDNAGSEHGAQS